MKKSYFITLIASVFIFSAHAQVEYTDDFESYDIGYISPQTDYWRTWSAAGAGTAEDAIVNEDESRSGNQSLFIDGSEIMDPIFLVPNAPSQGVYTVQWYAYIPAGKSGYWNMQGELTPPGLDWVQALMGGNVYLNCDGSTPGVGGVTGVIDCSQFDAVFYYPEDEWFKVTCVYDLDDETWGLRINGVLQFENYPFEFGTRPFSELAGLDFYSASTNNHMYIDDMSAGPGVLSTENFAENVFSVYPNPVKDILNIDTQVAVDKVVVFDVLGKVVLHQNPGTVSPTINMAALPSGTYFVKVFIDDNSKIVKILK